MTVLCVYCPLVCGSASISTSKFIRITMSGIHCRLEKGLAFTSYTILRMHLFLNTARSTIVCIRTTRTPWILPLFLQDRTLAMARWIGLALSRIAGLPRYTCIRNVRLKEPLLLFGSKGLPEFSACLGELCPYTACTLCYPPSWLEDE